MDVQASNLIGSFAQAQQQQHDAAALQDAARDRAARLTQRLNQMSEQQAEAVEDFYDAADGHSVNEDGAGQGGAYHPPPRQKPRDENTTIDLKA